MELKYAIGGTIRRIRHEQGKTLREVAGSKYISFNYLSEIERGTKEASNQFLELIADSLNLTTAQLLKEIYEYLEAANTNKGALVNV
jgi:transcriptional regulator with XRE-family HTH domain